MTLVFVFAFDPLEELDEREGLVSVQEVLAERLIAERRAERVADHVMDAGRFVPGSPAYLAARDALRAARRDLATPAPRKTRAPRET